MTLFIKKSVSPYFFCIRPSFCKAIMRARAHTHIFLTDTHALNIIALSYANEKRRYSTDGSDILMAVTETSRRDRSSGDSKTQKVRGPRWGNVFKGASDKSI